MSQEPTRLIDDAGVSEALRADLHAAASAQAPYEAAAGLVKLQASLAVGSGSALSTLALAKILILGVGIAGIVVGALIYSSEDKAETSSAAIREDVIATHPVAGAEAGEPTKFAGPTELNAAVEPVSTDDSVKSTEPIEAANGDESMTPKDKSAPSHPALTSSSKSKKPRGQALHKDESLAPADPDERLRLEIIHLAQTRQALATSPDKALGLARKGQKQFSGGMFGEERQAVIVIALAKLGRAMEAQRQGTKFLKQHPKGPFSARVRVIVQGANEDQ